MVILQHLGIASVVILAVGLSLIPMVWPYSIKHTFSQHIARHKSSTLYYSILFSIFLPLFLTFFIAWLVPHLQLPTIVTVLIVAVAITQYACTFIPETHGWRRQWHRALAGSSAFGLIPIVFSLTFVPHMPVQVTATCSSILMLILPIIFLHPKFHKFGESYIIQAIYYAAFFTPVIVATYTI